MLAYLFRVLFYQFDRTTSSSSLISTLPQSSDTSLATISKSMIPCTQSLSQLPLNISTYSQFRMHFHLERSQLVQPSWIFKVKVFGKQFSKSLTLKTFTSTWLTIKLRSFWLLSWIKAHTLTILWWLNFQESLPNKRLSTNTSHTWWLWSDKQTPLSKPKAHKHCKLPKISSKLLHDLYSQ